MLTENWFNAESSTGRSINGFGKLDLESIWFDRDSVDLERRLAGPFESFERKRLDTSNGPAAIGTATQQLATGSEFDVENSCGKALAKRIARSLPNTVDLLRRGPHQD